MVRISMPNSPTARTVRRNASTPRRCPSPRGRPRAAAQRPLPSMMMATWCGTSGRAAVDDGALTSDMVVPDSPLSDGHDLFFFRRQQMVDLADGLIGRFLHLLGLAIMLVLADLVILFQPFEDIE